MNKSSERAEETNANLLDKTVKVPEDEFKKITKNSEKVLDKFRKL